MNLSPDGIDSSSQEVNLTENSDASINNSNNYNNDDGNENIDNPNESIDESEQSTTVQNPRITSVTTEENEEFLNGENILSIIIIVIGILLLFLGGAILVRFK